MPAIQMKNVKMVYKSGTVVLEDFDLTINDGEFLVLFGPSGCGKTTILRLLAGLERPAEGEMFFGSELVNKKLPQDRNVAMVFQNYSLYSHMTVYKNIGFPLKMKKASKEEIDKRVMQMAKLLDIEHLLNRRPRALSGGQRQRVALGRALVRSPQLFLLDEPLSNLDTNMRMELRAEIVRLHKALGTTFVYVTHDQTEAMVMSERLAVMDGGRILQLDTPHNVYDNPSDFIVAGLLGTPKMNFLPAELTGKGGKVFASFNDVQIELENIDVKHIGRQVILGIRPEDMHLEPEDRLKSFFISALYQTTESLGSESYGLFTHNGLKLCARIRNNLFMPVKEYPLAIDLEKLHIFDRETGKNIKMK